MATTTPTTTPNPDPTPPSESNLEPIPSVAVQKFYDEGGRLIDKDRPYNYEPKKDLPYPWPVLRPTDPKLNEQLKAEYDAFQAKKMREINTRASIRGTFEALAAMRDE